MTSEFGSNPFLRIILYAISKKIYIIGPNESVTLTSGYRPDKQYLITHSRHNVTQFTRNYFIENIKNFNLYCNPSIQNSYSYTPKPQFLYCNS